MTVANILTTIRFVLTPVFIAAFVMGQHAWAIILFCVAGFTDMIDGTVARLLKQPSVKGALLDPLADKFLVQSCFICLFAAGIIPWWLYIIFFYRDALLQCLRIVCASGGSFWLPGNRGNSRPWCRVSA